MKRLIGKSALITGAARGIGRGFAEVYTREGATVAIADTVEKAGTGPAEELTGMAIFLSSAPVDYKVAQTYGVHGGQGMS